MMAVDPPPRGSRLAGAPAPVRPHVSRGRDHALLATGASNKQIAAELGISPHAGRTHAERVFCELGVKSRKALGLRLLT
jgi:DNA-binding CsgD family transcriptional regulator